ncbi:hypothetical protein [Stenotrophomonas maltophilia]|uniref:hypothetical protein n=1 Tax=Stenotrophomonas maltophilia TaxID=40324 RepID=UPI001CB9C837|nr:hypothetical protein [Stenotrophomonas maltophilia]
MPAPTTAVTSIGRPQAGKVGQVGFGADALAASALRRRSRRLPLKSSSVFAGGEGRRRAPQPGQETGQQGQRHHRVCASPVRRQHIAGRRFFPCRQVLAIDQRHHDLRAIEHALVDIALTEARHDRVVDDASGVRVR